MILPADPGASYRIHKDEIDAAIHRVLESGWYIHGEEVTAFETEFSRFTGVEYAVGTGSGTEALHIALRASGVGPGDFVLTVAHTAVATVAAIELAGAEPIFVDIDPDTFTMDVNRLEETLADFHRHRTAPERARLKAVIPVHLYGHPANMPEIMNVAERYNLQVIEDCAQAHGATLDGRMTGSWGMISAYSFYPTKNLGAIGDAGAVVTGSPELAEKVRLLAEYGWRQRYVSEVPGWNTRLDPIQAAVLRVKLRHLERENDQRRELARIYNERLSCSSSVRVPVAAENVRHVYHQYVIRTPRRDELKDVLQKNEIGTLVHYPVPIHLQPAYRERLSQNDLEHTEKVCKDILSLPIMPHLSPDQINEVSSVILKWGEEVSHEDRAAT